jgi:hypothetical protein
MGINSVELALMLISELGVMLIVCRWPLCYRTPMETPPIRREGIKFVAELKPGDKLCLFKDRLFIVNPNEPLREIKDNVITEMPIDAELLKLFTEPTQ